MAKIDRIGEENVNNFGSKIIITRYRMNADIDVYFPEYKWTAKDVQYNNFKKGEIKCPYERRYFGIGYLGEGKYKSRENGKDTRVYSTWKSMLQRCYSEKYHEKIQLIKIVSYQKNGITFKTLLSGMMIIIMRLAMKRCV